MANPSSASNSSSPTGFYGAPPPELASVPEGAVQFSPLVPGAARLEDQPEATLTDLTMLAPPGALTRSDTPQAPRTTRERTSRDLESPLRDRRRR